MPLSNEHRITLKDVAGRSIDNGLQNGGPLAVRARDFPEALREIRATFVTLEVHRQLRGCIGALEARLPLVEDVALHAYEAALEDPRFPPLREIERSKLDIHISILSPPEPMKISGEADLLNQLRAGVDGLIIESRGRRATFLPSVWEELAAPEEFLMHLKMKAGWRESGWPADARAWRYATESF